MNVSKLLLTTGIIGAISITGLASTAQAWHPKGIITKKVQNITASTALSEADSTAQAVAAKPGDTLNYVIEVRNDGTAASNGYNDMDKTIMTDTLPTGIELVSNPAQRQITENLGLLKPGEKRIKEYAVKVTAKVNGAITNTACFTGDSTANDNPQKGCNPAVINVTVPPTPEAPVVTTPVPETPKPVSAPIMQTPVELPKTGMTENLLGIGIVLSIAYYMAQRYAQSKRDLKEAYLTAR